MVHEATEASPHGAVGRDDELWQAQEGPGLTLALAMSDEEAGAKRYLARDRMPAPEVMDFNCVATESHDDSLVSSALGGVGELCGAAGVGVGEGVVRGGRAVLTRSALLAGKPL